MRGGLASDQLTSKEKAAAGAFRSKAYDALGASRYESGRAGGSDPTGGAKFFYFDYGQPAPPFTKGKAPVAVYGPFRNTVKEKGESERNPMETLRVYK